MNNVTSAPFKYWGLHLLTLPVSTYVTEGLAKISDFEVLRHGTSFPQYLSILRTGADPLRGSETVDADPCTKALFSKNCKNRFFLFKDSKDPLTGNDPLQFHMMKRMYPRMYATRAGNALAKSTKNKVILIAQKILYEIVSFFFCPTLRFIYKKEEFQTFNSEKEFKEQISLDPPKFPRFISDEGTDHIAYKTPDALPNDRIGLIGLCKHAKWQDIKKTFAAKPNQFLLGTIQLIVGIYLTTISLGILL